MRWTALLYILLAIWSWKRLLKALRIQQDVVKPAQTALQHEHKLYRAQTTWLHTVATEEHREDYWETLSVEHRDYCEKIEARDGAIVQQAQRNAGQAQAQEKKDASALHETLDRIVQQSSQERLELVQEYKDDLQLRNQVLEELRACHWWCRVFSQFTTLQSQANELQQALNRDAVRVQELDTDEANELQAAEQAWNATIQRDEVNYQRDESIVQYWWNKYRRDMQCVQVWNATVQELQQHVAYLQDEEAYYQSHDTQALRDVEWQLHQATTQRHRILLSAAIMSTVGLWMCLFCATPRLVQVARHMSWSFWYSAAHVGLLLCNLAWCGNVLEYLHSNDANAVLRWVTVASFSQALCLHTTLPLTRSKGVQSLIYACMMWILVLIEVLWLSMAGHWMQTSVARLHDGIVSSGILLFSVRGLTIGAVYCYHFLDWCNAKRMDETLSTMSSGGSVSEQSPLVYYDGKMSFTGTDTMPLYYQEHQRQCQQSISMASSNGWNDIQDFGWRLLVLFDLFVAYCLLLIMDVSVQSKLLGYSMFWFGLCVLAWLRYNHPSFVGVPTLPHFVVAHA